MKTRILLCLIFLLGLLAGCGGVSPTPLPAAPLKIVVRDDKFEPNILTGKVNQPLELTV